MRRKTFIYFMIVMTIMLTTIITLYWSVVQSAQAQAEHSTCQPTGYMQDSMILTAARIVTKSRSIDDTSINATGCNIGVYFAPSSSGTISDAKIFGANYYGVLNNGGRVTITRSQIHDIGEKPLNGSQHGVGISFISDSRSSASGSIIDNRVQNYQKNGIVVKGSNTSATVKQNTVLGQGPVNYIAQNGIEVGFGAKATVSDNTVRGNSYTGPNGASSGGILVFGGSCYGAPLTTNTRITGNTLIGNDVGVFLSNLSDTTSCPAPATTPTRILVRDNLIRNDRVNNKTGTNLAGQPGGYQAGVSDQGNFDIIEDNHICAAGYTQVAPPPPYLYRIDITRTNNPIVRHNTSC